MRILIVDDEPLVRIGIKSSVNWAEHGIEIIGEADDGNKALALIEELNPDAVLLDIKMPNKDGLDVLREMNQKQLSSAVVILSSFDDLNLVKEAMKLGAADYFHKPTMNGDQIKEVLLQLQNQVSTSQVDADIQSSDQTVLKQMLSGVSEGENDTKLKEGHNHVIVFSVKGYDKVKKRYPNENPSILTNAIQHLLGELLSKEKEVEFLQLHNNKYVLVTSDKTSKSSQEQYNRLHSLLQLIRDSLQRFVNVDTIFGISETFHSFKEMKAALRQAEEVLEKHFYQNEAFIFSSQQKRMDDEATKTAALLVVKMKEALTPGKSAEFMSHLAKWEAHLQETMCMNKESVLKIYDGLTFMIAESKEYLERKDKVRELESFAEVSAFYRTVFESKMNQHNSELSPIVQSLVDFVEENYHKEISLASLGERFNVSPNYISRLFKKETDRGLFDFLQETRIERAKLLLKSSNLKIYEVAEEVGFKSQVHFAIVFNKYVGISPKDYRRERV